MNLKILRQSTREEGADGEVKYAYNRSGYKNRRRIILRHGNRWYWFKRGFFYENETYNDPDFFRWAGSVMRFKVVYGAYTDNNGQDMQDSFIEFAEMLYREDNSVCTVQKDRSLHEKSIYWSYEPHEFAGEDLKMTSGVLIFVGKK